MDLSRLESGMAQIKKEQLELNELLRQVFRDMYSLCSAKGLVLECKLSGEPLLIDGDKDMLYRLFVNLIGNSIKFTSKGRVTISSSVAGGKKRAEVSDTGIGISQEDLDTIFDRFVQKTPSSQGIGVGLTISRDIAALHNAKIWAESEGLGKGSVFKVEFP
jgi:two-component system CheB/CheR fusion protein